eukprot:TRINITY_DN29045_c0_g1_i1.p1 TRINITY_DN29045_c0_g1~~TRINITY_DN29045_c0_g1_i1.p1  ORF type:complete len:371 (-),score=26.71 TRINITY_DN29045_c0_g1_i1:281-1393(-)
MANAVFLLLLALAPSAVCRKRMPKVDPVAIDHVRIVNLSGRSTKMQTLAVDPPVFLVSQFLTPAEADAIVEANNRSDFDKSLVSHPSEGGISLPPRSKQFRSMFKRYDRDRNDALDNEELTEFLQREVDMPNHDDEWDTFLEKYGLSGPTVSLESFKSKNIDLGKYVQWLTATKPQLRQRYSSQKWLKYNLDITRMLKERASALSGFPSWVIDNAEDLQLLRYQSHGHYACHHDDGPDGLEEGSSVRLATLALFLNTPEAGGEIAFPGADHPNASKYTEEDWSELESACQPTPRCTSLGGLVVTPRKGDAVFWYNMKVEKWSANGGTVPGVDALYWNSMHCGAEVHQGEKWMANMWFRSRPKSKRQKDEF